ncbi:hypothetical protein FHX57_007663 [Paraburkholderia tropica]|uniref:Uncharacterized protein n=1 Tax=Paraburkholderia tropica TaxID=92647 RepID=A0AAQ1GPC0_9BURK|nr:hypothetical protein [Paraburkholderia tropica]MBB6324331.1 hypothetical protein [Paraburkholderia tropica]SEK15275.1 hypothetical protein SAMN05216550_13617 [Paraburkholderia tropica]
MFVALLPVHTVNFRFELTQQGVYSLTTHLTLDLTWRP